jgi:hypothetical protein
VIRAASRRLKIMGDPTKVPEPPEPLEDPAQPEEEEEDGEAEAETKAS